MDRLNEIETMLRENPDRPNASTLSDEAKRLRWSKVKWLRYNWDNIALVDSDGELKYLNLDGTEYNYPSYQKHYWPICWSLIRFDEISVEGMENGTFNVFEFDNMFVTIKGVKYKAPKDLYWSLVNIASKDTLGRLYSVVFDGTFTRYNIGHGGRINKRNNIKHPEKNTYIFAEFNVKDNVYRVFTNRNELFLETTSLIELDKIMYAYEMKPNRATELTTLTLVRSMTFENGVLVSVGNNIKQGFEVI